MSTAPLGDEKTKGETFLRKAEREACWAARDKFWTCYKANGEDAGKCPDARKVFVDLCPQSWVKHFDRKYQFEKFKAQVNEAGFQGVDEKFEQKKAK